MLCMPYLVICSGLLGHLASARCSSLGPAEAAALRKAAEELPDIEFIIQRNEETKALWEVTAARNPDRVSTGTMLPSERRRAGGEGGSEGARARE